MKLKKIYINCNGFISSSFLKRKVSVELEIFFLFSVLIIDSNLSFADYRCLAPTVDQIEEVRMCLIFYTITAIRIDQSPARLTLGVNDKTVIFHLAIPLLLTTRPDP